MALKTVLGQVIIWCDDDDNFDKTKITNIRDEELNFWAEIEEIKPPVKEFSNGDPTEICRWYKAKVITDLEEQNLTPPHLFSGRMALTRVLDSTPENVSFRWKY